MENIIISIEGVIGAGMARAIETWPGEPVASPEVLGAATLIAALAMDRSAHLRAMADGTVEVYDCIATPQRVIAIVEERGGRPFATYRSPDGSTITGFADDRREHARLVRFAIGEG